MADKPRYRRQQGRGLIDTVRLGIFAVAALSTLGFGRDRISNLWAVATNPDCIIKGNISISSGRRLYHLPGMKDYEITNIQLKHGERWFCSEADAISAGWTKAPR